MQSSWFIIILSNAGLQKFGSIETTKILSPLPPNYQKSFRFQSRTLWGPKRQGWKGVQILASDKSCRNDVINSLTGNIWVSFELVGGCATRCEGRWPCFLQWKNRRCTKRSALKVKIASFLLYWSTF